MNKKYMIPVMICLGLTVVMAIGYYALFSASFNVMSSIETTCGDEDLGEVFDGDQVVGTACSITNLADSEREIVISYEAEEGITTTYLGELSLTKKDTAWAAVGDPITIGYTIVGDDFEVTGVEEGYTAIYYKDEVVGLEGRIANPQPAISIVGTGNLPQADDSNIDELANYCAEPDNYNQCKGAKLWIVPNSDLNEGTLNWANMANYYYEMDLIQYNAEGEIVLSPGASLTITPVYDIAPGVAGTQTVTTQVA